MLQTAITFGEFHTDWLSDSVTISQNIFYLFIFATFDISPFTGRFFTGRFYSTKLFCADCRIQQCQ